jgi:tetratricopeptide (TPR) repeat protein
VERRFAVHADPHQQEVSVAGRSTPTRAGHVRAALAALVVLAGSPVFAAPKSGDARAQFDRGVAAYTKGDYATATEALGASFVLEADPETLFAWAQTERKLGHCERAIELYTKLLAMDLPAENKQAIDVQIDECKAVLAEEQQREPAPVVTPPPEPASFAHAEGRAWWKDPVGGALVGAGVVGLGLGTVFLVQGHSAEADKDGAATYAEYQRLADRATSRGRLGVIGLVAGGALVAGGIVWYVTREPTEPTLTTLLLPSGGGVAVSGRF